MFPWIATLVKQKTGLGLHRPSGNGKSGRRVLLDIGALQIRDRRVRRSFTKPPAKPRQPVGLAAGQHLHPAVRKVSGVSRDTQAMGLFPGTGPEEHALYAA